VRHQASSGSPPNPRPVIEVGAADGLPAPVELELDADA
jgi:hypothetical protein